MSKKVLGQSNPSSATVTTLYTVPSSKEAVISSISIANLSGSTTSAFRIIIQKSADASSTILDSQYLAKDITVGISDTTILTIGITLATGDVVKVYSSSANLTFLAFGDEAAA